MANLAGVISLAAGLLMWVTSLHPVRKRFFELFFYTHQLYVVFIVFLALHVGDFVFSIAAGAVFLFMLDRFLRFWQSRAKVDIVSAACRPCGTVELVFSKPASKSSSTCYCRLFISVLRSVVSLSQCTIVCWFVQVSGTMLSASSSFKCASCRSCSGTRSVCPRAPWMGGTTCRSL